MLYNLSFLALTTCYLICFFFFFSSRRRHTRWNCDWSSDVCSSDLPFADAVRNRVGIPTIAVGVISSYDDVNSDRKSTRLNSSHSSISYAVFCLKKKKKGEDERVVQITLPRRVVRFAVRAQLGADVV